MRAAPRGGILRSMSVRGRMGVTRETRLLAATIGISLIVLLVLSRFRFPAATDTPRPSAAAQPLARLAARAAFDDLSLAVRELSSRVNGSLVVVRVSAPPVDDGSIVPAGDGTSRLVPALRVRDDAAVVAVQDGATVEGVLGAPGPAVVMGRDPVRGLVVVRVPVVSAPVLSIREDEQPPATPGYAAVSEASIGGTALRPVFIGRSDAVTDPRWDTPVFTLGRGLVGDAGAPVFLLDGRLAGVVGFTEGAPTLVPASAVMATVEQLLRGTLTTTGDIGVTVQPMDATLARLTGTGSGAVVAAVAPDGPADGVLAPGDVITAVNNQPVRTAEAWRLRVSRAAAGTRLTLTLRRHGEYLNLPVTVRHRPSQESESAAASTTSVRGQAALGLTLRAAAGAGAEVVRVQPGSVGDAAGLRAGDLVVSLGTARAPSPGVITAAFDALTRGRVLYLSIERDGQPRLVALSR